MTINFGCSGTLPKDKLAQWQIEGIFGQVLDEVEIKELQEQKILANVSIFPLKFIHSKKVDFNYREVDENGIEEDSLTAHQRAYQREALYLRNTSRMQQNSAEYVHQADR